MSNTRLVSNAIEPANPSPDSTTPTLENKQPVSALRLFTTEAAKVMYISGTVAWITMPFSYLKHQQHMACEQASGWKMPTWKSVKPVLSHLPHAFSLTTAGAILTRYAYSAKLSTIKSLTATQRNKLLKPTDEKTETMEKREDSNTKGKRLLVNPFVFTAGMAFIDTTTTNYHTTLNTFNNHKNFMKDKYKLAFIPPKPRTKNEYLKIGAAGYPIRFFRNNVMLAGLICSPDSNNNPAATTITGCVTGFIGNTLDLVHGKQIIGMNAQTFKTASLLKTMEKVFAEQGAKGFIHGYPVSMISTAVLYLAIKNMNESAQRNIPKLEKTLDKLACLSMRFFNREKPATGAPTIAPTTENLKPCSAPKKSF